MSFSSVVPTCYLLHLALSLKFLFFLYDLYFCVTIFTSDGNDTRRRPSDIEVVCMISPLVTGFYIRLFVKGLTLRCPTFLKFLGPVWVLDTFWSLKFVCTWPLWSLLYRSSPVLPSEFHNCRLIKGFNVWVPWVCCNPWFVLNFIYWFFWKGERDNISLMSFGFCSSFRIFFGSPCNRYLLFLIQPE